MENCRFQASMAKSQTQEEPDLKLTTPILGLNSENKHFKTENRNSIILFQTQERAKLSMNSTKPSKSKTSMIKRS